MYAKSSSIHRLWSDEAHFEVRLYRVWPFSVLVNRDCLSSSCLFIFCARDEKIKVNKKLTAGLFLQLWKIES